MPSLRKHNKVAAVLVSDIHLSLKMPTCRKEQVPWMEVMAEYLRQLKEYSEKHNAPILCAGDIFDKWNSPPELINFALEHLPFMYAVPGQHDLPAHNYEERYRSSYDTLVRAGRIQNLKPYLSVRITDKLWVTGFPWGFPLKPCTNLHIKKGELMVAVCHHFIWSSKKNGFTGIGMDTHTRNLAGKMDGFDVALFGDNHKGFLTKTGELTILNNGGFMRRSVDQIEYTPSFGVLYGDGSVKRVALETEGFDYFDEVRTDKTSTSINMDSLMKQLNTASVEGYSFRDILLKRMLRNKTSKEIQTIIKECIDEH